MATNRADILSRTFTLPEQPTQEVGRAGGAGRGSATDYNSDYFGIPEPASGLQWTNNVSELSNRYYQKLTALDQYAKSMWLNNKIDVTRPDYSNQQAVLAAQAYQQELGNIMSLADELKESQKQLVADRAIANQNKGRFGQDAMAPGVTYASQQEGSDKFYSTEVDPSITFGKDYANKTVDSQDDYNARQQYVNQLQKELKKEYERTGNPAILEQYNATLGLGPSINLESQRNNLSGQPNSVFSTMGEIADTLIGGHPNYKPTGKINTASGKEWYSLDTSPLIGKRIFGDSFEPTSFITDGETTYAVNVDPNTGKTTRKAINKEDLDAYARSYFKSTYQDKEYEAALNEAGSLGKLPKTTNELGIPTYKIPAEKFATEQGKQRASALKEEAKQTEELFNQYSDVIKNKGDEIVKPENWFRSLVPQGILDFVGNTRVQTIPLNSGNVTLTERGTGDNKYIEISIKDVAGKSVNIVDEDSKTKQKALTKLTVRNGSELLSAIKKYGRLADFGKEIIKSQIGTTGGAQTTFEQPEQATNPELIEQDGNIFKLNPKTGEYEFFKKK